MNSKIVGEFLLTIMLLGHLGENVQPATSVRELPTPPSALPVSAARMLIPEIVRAALLPVAADRYEWPKLRDADTRGIEVTAASAMVVDRASGKVLYEKTADELRPIASLTKLMTVLVFLELNPDLNTVVTIGDGDRVGLPKTFFRSGDQATARDLIIASLVGSSNEAALSLVRASGLTEAEFVRRMNARARALGMERTRFTEVTGLEARNVSTAHELTKLLRVVAEVPVIRRAVSKEIYEVSERDRTVQIPTTNLLLNSFLNAEPYRIALAKTGSLDEAGFCMGILVEENDHGVIVVVLGSTDHFSRFTDAKALAYWALERWEWEDDRGKDS